MRNKVKPTKDNPAICLCHQVTQKEIEEAIAKGCNTLPKLFDATAAGVGPCGGSCRPILQKMLDHYLQSGEFLESPRGVLKKRR